MWDCYQLLSDFWSFTLSGKFLAYPRVVCRKRVVFLFKIFLIASLTIDGGKAPPVLAALIFVKYDRRNGEL